MNFNFRNYNSRQTCVLLKQSFAQKKGHNNAEDKLITIELFYFILKISAKFFFQLKF